MSTPLYKPMKENGSTTYVLPGAQKDISASKMNDNYKMRFNKFLLLNIPIEKMNINDGFDPNFSTESNFSFTNNADKVINSLRNYVANREVTIKESKLTNNSYFYNPNELRTTSERNLWKWLIKTGVMQVEPATPDDQYIDSAEFQINENLPSDYFKEILWRERDTIDYTIIDVTPISALPDDYYQITLSGSTNFKPGDVIILKSDVNNSSLIGLNPNLVYHIEVASVSDSGNSKNNVITTKNRINLVDNSFITITWINGSKVTATLKYNRIIQYIGEITSTDNVQEANKAYTTAIAYVPHQAGQTPDILFRITYDSNYSPGLQYPILPSQDQPEIIGAEDFSSPILMNPDKYPGDHYAQFDQDLKYVNSPGLQDRKRGPYFGIPNATDRKAARVASTPYVYPEFDGAAVDGLTVNFDPSIVTKMNIPGKISRNFDEFNSQSFNSQPPKDFVFNTLIWLYEVEDVSKSKVQTDVETNTTVTTSATGQVTVTDIKKTETFNNPERLMATNVYAIEFLNGLDQEEPVESLRGIPTLPKYVTNGKQDGLSYKFSLNLNYNINNEVIIDKFDPNKIYNVFGFDLFNEVMKRVSQTNDSFLQIITEFINLKTDILNLKGLIYTQTDLKDINFKIQSLYELLNLYKTVQIADSESIVKEIDQSTNPPQIKLHSIDSRWGDIKQYLTSQMWDSQTELPYDISITVPKGKDFLVNIVNDDQFDIPFEGKTLNIVLDKDLDYKQTCQIKVWAKNAKFNKKLKVSIKSSLVTLTTSEINTGYQLIKPLNIPIDLNTNPNENIDGINKRWNNIPELIYPKAISLEKISDQFYLVFELDQIFAKSFRLGDVMLVDNCKIAFPPNQTIDFSNQMSLAAEPENNEITFLVDPISAFQVYETLTGGSKRDIPFDYLTQPVCIRPNKGLDISITAVDRVSTSIAEKYMIQINNLNKYEF